MHALVRDAEEARCTSWSSANGPRVRSRRSSSCSSSSSTSSAGGVTIKKVAKVAKTASAGVLPTAGGWRPAVGAVPEGTIPEGVPPAARRELELDEWSDSPRLEGYLKEKNPKGITWWKRRWAVLDPQAGTLSFFKERWQSQVGLKECARSTSDRWSCATISSTIGGASR